MAKDDADKALNKNISGKYAGDFVFSYSLDGSEFSQFAEVTVLEAEKI